MGKIRPSTRLKVVSIHKLQDLFCPRYYYFRHVLNMESKWLNPSFWYGSMNGAGFEAMLMGKSKRQIEAAMKAEDRRYRRRYEVREEHERSFPVTKLAMWRVPELIQLYLDGAVHHPMYALMKIDEGQERFRVQLKESDVVFVGTKDGEGSYRERPVYFENKAVASGTVNAAYVGSRSFDMQVNGYAVERRYRQLPALPKCLYCVFKKTTKRVKIGQDDDGFLEEMEREIVADRKRDGSFKDSKFYCWWPITLNKTQVTECGRDIELKARELSIKYERLGEEKVLDPHEWGKCDRQCSGYSGCDYLQICRDQKRIDIYRSQFIAKEIRYDDERKELQT